MKSEKVLFTNKNGFELSARLEKPLDQEPLAYAIFAHCFTCSKNLLAVKQISKGITDRGIAVLRFDFTGLGDSEGDFSDTNFSSNVEDLVAAADFLRAHYEAPKMLVGHSLGGAAVIVASGFIDGVEAVATVGAPSRPAHVTHLFKEQIEEIQESGDAEVSIGGRAFVIKDTFLKDLKDDAVTKLAKGFNKALLVMHSPQDNTVGIENARDIYESAKHPKSFVSLDGADHLLTNKTDALYVGEMVGSWASRYLPQEVVNKVRTTSEVVTRTTDESYTTDIFADPHHLTADEPAEVGGNDFGPTPYDYLLASIGSCTSMTLQMYAKRKKWPLKEAIVHVDHNKVHAQDCETCETDGSKIDLIERKIELVGPLDDDQKARLLEIADKCPVHKTLHGNLKVQTELMT